MTTPLAAVPDRPSRVGIERLSLAEAVERTRQREPFLVDKLVCSTLTLVYGEPLAGKSTLAALLITSALRDAPFLDRELTHRVTKVALVTTEVDGPEEYARRVLEAGLDATDRRLAIYPVGSLTEDRWIELAEMIDPDEATLVVVDNLTQVLSGGSINDDAVIRVAFDGLRRLTACGAAVVVVAHVSEKTGPRGGKSTKPMGNTAISAGARWRVRIVSKSNGKIELVCDGNAARGTTFVLERGDKETDLRVVEEVDGRQAASLHRKRHAVAAARFAEIADWAIANAPGVSQAEMARRLTANYPELSSGKDPARQVAKALSQKRKIGGFLQRAPDGEWQRHSGTHQ